MPPPLAYQHVGPHNEAEHLDGFRNMCDLRYDLLAELRTNHGLYDLAKTAKYLTAFTYGRARGMRTLIDDPYMVFAAEWLAERTNAFVNVLRPRVRSAVADFQRHEG